MIVSLHTDDIALRANARIDNGYVHRTRGKIMVRTREPKARFGWPVHGYLVRDVNDPCLGHVTQDSPLHRGNEWPLMTEISGNRDDAGGGRHVGLGSKMMR